MQKLLIVSALFIQQIALAQKSPWQIFDIYTTGGGIAGSAVKLTDANWAKLNPDGFPENTEMYGNDYDYREFGYNDQRTMGVNFLLPRTADRKLIWLAGASLGSSSATIASSHRYRQTDRTVLDTLTSSNGYPTQYLIADSSYNSDRLLSGNFGTLGLSIGFRTNPARQFSFGLRAIAQFGLSMNSNAQYRSTRTENRYLTADTSDVSGNTYASTSGDQEVSSFSTGTMFYFGLSLPISVNLQLSSVRPVLSRFSIGLEGGPGFRMISIPGADAYSTGTFSMSMTFAYRFKTWIPDSQNLRKLRENQK